MFEFLFKYPRTVFSRGEFVLLGAWPKWILFILLLAAAGGLAWLIRSKLPQASPHIRNWKAGAIWLLQFAMAALLLILLWQPAIMVAELRPQQNIIAVLVDDSRSMAIADNGATRESQAVKALESGVLDQLQKKFQVRLYRADGRLTRIAKLDELKTATPASATRIGDGLNQLAGEAADLPIGAVVLLSDGADNSGGIDLDTISTLRSRRIPVHTVGFGARADSARYGNQRCGRRTSRAGRFPAGSQSQFSPARFWRAEIYADGSATAKKSWPLRQITFASDGQVQNETLLVQRRPGGLQDFAICDRSASGRRKSRQQFRLPLGKRRIR